MKRVETDHGNYLICLYGIYFFVNKDGDFLNSATKREWGYSDTWTHKQEKIPSEFHARFEGYVTKIRYALSKNLKIKPYVLRGEEIISPKKASNKRNSDLGDQLLNALQKKKEFA